MGKNIVLCSDGTGNQDVKNRGTNVFKLYEAVDIQGHKTAPLTPQVAFYDDGVGTANAFARVVGGAFGWGFSRNVKKMYRELVNVYEPGDKIFLFGFSRGAYTIRALAAFIQFYGVLDQKHYSTLPRGVLTHTIKRGWDEFSAANFKHADAAERRGRIPTQAELAAERKASIERRTVNHAVKPNDPVDIAFIGVWDTVGAIGTPFDGLRELLSRYIRPIWFADNTLGPEVSRACHALALDEERRTFHPELWNEQDGKDERIKQVWFAGAHSNVGGGYPKHGMSLVSLDWMMNEARQAGLRFIKKDLDFISEHQDVHDKLYDSRAGLAVYYRWSPRNLRELCKEHRIPAPKIHISLFERIAAGTNGMNNIDAYSPGNLPVNIDVDTSGSIDSWPDSRVKDKIASLLPPDVQQSRQWSPLEDMSREVNSGKKSYYSFLALTGFTVTALATAAVVTQRRVSNPVQGRRGSRQPESRSPLLLASLGAMAVGSIAIHRWASAVDCALCKQYTQFWHERRRELRQLLLNNQTTHSSGLPPSAGSPGDRQKDKDLL